MPVLRVSPMLWKEVSAKAGELGVSLTYSLDKIVDEMRLRIRELETAKERPLQAVSDLQVKLDVCQQECAKLKEQIITLKAERDDFEIQAELYGQTVDKLQAKGARARVRTLSEQDARRLVHGAGSGQRAVIQAIYSSGYGIVKRRPDEMGPGG